MSSDRPGVVFVRPYTTDPEVTVDILKAGVTVGEDFPDRLQVPGMTEERQWYLYEEVGPLCHNSNSACPRPAVPKPSKSLSKKS